MRSLAEKYWLLPSRIRRRASEVKILLPTSVASKQRYHRDFGLGKTAASDPSNPSTAMFYHTSPLAPEKLPQCRLCLKSHAVGQPVSEAERDRPIQIRKRECQARQAESQYSLPRSEGSRSLAAGTAKACVLKEVEESSSDDTTVGRCQAASESIRVPRDI